MEIYKIGYEKKESQNPSLLRIINDRGDEANDLLL